MNTEYIEAKVSNFMHDAEVVYATPGTDNHSANFYGDTHICELDHDDLVNLIEIAISDWTWYDGENEVYGQARVDLAINAILSDMQFDRPEQSHA